MPVESAAKVLKKHGKSFNFAKLFLSVDTGDAAARLYRFCRLIDDIADESEDKSLARAELEKIKQDISKNTSVDLVVNDFLSLCQNFAIDRHHGNTLIDGVLQDLDAVALVSFSELVNYAFKVAGVVGLMMAPLLGASRDSHLFAVDLGIAMQLTNIARDVLEDAQMQRRYIPEDWIGEISPEQVQKPSPQQYTAICKAVQKLLELAEQYYDSGVSGLSYVNPKDKRAIAVAAYIYREIGRKLAKGQYDYLQGRVMIGNAKKSVLAIKALVDVSTGKIANKHTNHNSSLHRFLTLEYRNNSNKVPMQ